MVDTSRLGAQMAQQYFTCTVLDIPSGAAPKLIMVRLPTISGPANVARWLGFPNISVGDSVICRRDPNDSDVLIVEGTGDEAITGGAWPAPDEIVVGTTRYASLAAAISAASTGNTIKFIGSYTITSSHLDQSKALTMQGINQEESIISGAIAGDVTLDISAVGAILRNCTVISTASSGVVNGGLSISADGVLLDNVNVTAQVTATIAHAISISGSTTSPIRLKECRAVCSGGTSSYGLYQNVGVNTVIEGGYYSGTTADIYINNSGAVVFLLGPTLANDTLTVVSGSAVGYYYTSGGSLVVLGSAGIGLVPSYKLDVDGPTRTYQVFRDISNSVADDTAINPGTVAVGNRFFFSIITNGAEYFIGICTYNGITAIASSGFSVVAGSGALTGTTGPDGTINVRDSNGSLYIENRGGGARNIGYHYFGCD